MQIGHLAQADIAGPDAPARFWMDTCAGRDQVAMTLLREGWAAYEPPLPTLMARWCRTLGPVLLDVGANTGFYSLLALATGARQVHAFEPVPEIAAVLRGNATTSELGDRLVLHNLALGDLDGQAPLYFPLAGHGLVETSASLNQGFRRHHAEQRPVRVCRLDTVLPTGWPAPAPVLIKLDVETHEPAVLRGATALVNRLRPALVCELLPGCDLAFYADFCERHGYRHHRLDAGGPVEAPLGETSDTQRDHLFLPAEATRLWLDPLDRGGPA